MDAATTTQAEAERHFRLHVLGQLPILDTKKPYSYPNQESQTALIVPTGFSGFSPKRRIRGRNRPLPYLNFSDEQCLNILQSLGQAVYIFDRQCRIIYWNKAAGNMFGYSVAEVLGQNALELLAAPQALLVGQDLVERLTNGESWTGQFPVKNKMGETFIAVTTNGPFYDDEGSFLGVLCVSNDMRIFQDKVVQMSPVDEEQDSRFGNRVRSVTTLFGLDPQQPLQNAVASRFTSLASKVSSRVKSSFTAGQHNWEYHNGNGDIRQSDHGGKGNASAASSPIDSATHPSPFSVLSKFKDMLHRIAELSRNK